MDTSVKNHELSGLLADVQGCVCVVKRNIKRTITVQQTYEDYPDCVGTYILDFALVAEPFGFV